ncbi:sugar phosphate nucleotidyltransferase [Nitrosopumilus piranensis]|nr:sugar phosphate nucleotidyltransferase [Nitrosopumilus piranensis]
MKCVILAGGFGTRIFEETRTKPKPLVEIGGKPILWHIMKSYSFYGINDFVICCGYKSNMIQEYVKSFDESWNVIAIDTGLETMTGGRLKRVQKYVDQNTFCFTYGDTLNNVNISDLINFHKKHQLLATVTACHPNEKYGILQLKENLVVEFREKPPLENVWVNGGYFVLEPDIFDYIEGDNTVWEKTPLEKLACEENLSAFKHVDFYQPMDTLSDKNYLNKLWDSNNAKWRLWN